MSVRMRPIGVLAPEGTKFSWKRTFNRLGRLFTLVRPVPRQGDPVGRHAASSAPRSGSSRRSPSKFAIDRGIVPGDRQALILWTVLFVVAALLGWVAVDRPDLPLGLGRPARARRPAPRPLRAHPEARARLLRAQPRRLADLAPDERRRCARGARHRRPLLERPEHPAPVRHGGRAVLPRLAARARDAHGVPADGARDDALPHLLGARLPPHARAAGRRHRDARRGPRGRARRAVVPPRARQRRGVRRDQRQLPPAPTTAPSSSTPGTSRSSACSARPRPRSCSAYGGVLYFDDAITIGTLFAFMLFLSNFFDPIQALSQLFNTFLAASAALDKIFDVMDTEPELTDAPGARPLPPIEGAVELSGVHFHYGAGRRGAARHRPHRRRRPDRRARGPHRRGQVDARQAAGALLRPHRGHDPDRRPRPARRAGALAARAARHRAAGGLPVRRLDPREHRLRPSRRDARRGAARPPAPSAPTASSRRCPRATRPPSPSAAPRSRSASAS